jgi:prefoldin subunit 5
MRRVARTGRILVHAVAMGSWREPARQWWRSDFLDPFRISSIVYGSHKAARSQSKEHEMSDSTSQQGINRVSLLIALNAIVLLALVVFGYELVKLRDDILAARTLEIRVAELRRQVEGVRDNAAYKGGVAYLGKRLDTLTAALATNQGSVAYLGKRVDALSAALTSSQGSTAYLGKRVDVLSAALASSRGSTTYLGKRVDVLSAAITTMDGRIRYLAGLVDTLGKGLKNAAQRLTAATGRTSIVEDGLRLSAQKIKQLEARIQQLEARASKSGT